MSEIYGPHDPQQPERSELSDSFTIVLRRELATAYNRGSYGELSFEEYAEAHTDRAAAKLRKALRRDDERKFNADLQRVADEMRVAVEKLERDWAYFLKSMSTNRDTERRV